jgi:hypothetical protein
MLKKVTAISEAQKVTASSDDSTARGPIDRDSLIDAVETERQQIFRARATAQTAAKLLHELSVPTENELDLGFVLDVVSDLLKASLAGLDRVTLGNLDIGRRSCVGGRSYCREGIEAT